MILSAWIIWIIPSILSAITVYLVYKIYLFNKLKKSWLLIALGFFLIVLLRVLTLLYGEGYFPELFTSWDIWDPVIRLLDSICFILGFLTMIKSLENLDSVEKKVKITTKKLRGNKK